MKSMTGYGTAHGSIDGGMFSIDIRTLNHRYCEIIVRLPSSVAQFEPLIRQQVSKWFSRGRIEINLNETVSPSSSKKFFLNKDLANNHKILVTKLAKNWNVKPEELLSRLDPSSYIVSIDRSKLPQSWWGNLKKILNKACRQAVAMRSQEGKSLGVDQKKRIHKIESHAINIDKHLKSSMKKKRAKLRKKLISSKTDKTQMAQEEVSLINKLDATEEVTRFKSHISQYKKMLSGEVVGRRLDFILQEMNREITTFGAKVSDALASQAAIEVKAEIERLREQVQNIE